MNLTPTTDREKGGIKGDPKEKSTLPKNRGKDVNSNKRVLMTTQHPVTESK